MNLGNAMLRERSQTQKRHVVGVHLHERSGRSKSTEPKSRLLAARGWGREEWGVAADRCGVSFQGDGMFWN